MAFYFRLELEDGTSADPPTLKAAVPDWRAGNTIALQHGRVLRVVGTGLRKHQTANRLPFFWSKRHGQKSH
jgi:hypothetical protein